MTIRRFKTLFRLAIPICLLSVLLAVPVLTARSAPAIPTAMAPAATIVVDTTADELDGSPGNGDCSLREAITNANNDNGAQADCAAGSGDDIITLPADTYTLTGATGEDSNASGDLDITGILTINGTGATRPIIQAGTSSPVGGSVCGDCVDRVLHIHSGATVEINSVTIRYGKAPDGIDGAAGDACSGSHGGGIYNQSGTLILNDCNVAYNRAGDGGDGCTSTSYDGQGGHGGGIYVAGGTLELNSTAVRSNESGAGGDGVMEGGACSGGFGGGIYLEYSEVTLTGSMVGTNVAGAGGRGGDAASGDAREGASGGDGGGIYNLFGSLTLIDSTVSGNTTGAGGDGGDASSGNGGDGRYSGSGAGIYAVGSAASLVVVGSTISGNETGLGGNGGSGTGSDGADSHRGDGGGLVVYIGSDATLRDSAIRDNDAQFGGGLLGTYGPVVTLDGCTISGNIADQDGGGIFNGNGGTLILTNSTVSGNRACRSGGGILSSNATATTLTHVTITDNTADLDDNSSGAGGGFAASGGAITMTNTIVAENIDKGGENPDCYATVISGDYNLLGIGDSVGCTFASQPHDQVGTTAAPIDPLLGPLGDKGGPTWTHSLNVSSPAANQIPAGVNGCVLGIRDQRGVLRFPPCSIGAYEPDQVEEVYLPLVVKD